MANLDCIAVPSHLQRNAPDVLAVGVEQTGDSLLRGLARRIGRLDLAGLDLLDIGCGVRFTQTLINRHLAFASYTGVEVFLPIVEWLKEHVESRDERFRFVHWNVHHAMYNPKAPRMDTYETIPVDDAYDVVMGYSLFTHLPPDDAACMLRLARMVVRPHGYLFFTAFCDDSIPQFEDRVPEKPLLKAYYNNLYLEDLITNTGWTLVSYKPPGGHMMDSFLCQPTA
jgi:SAM-dependent methyltransferase